ncbi:pyridoxal-phosphate dependent enzyme [Streptomyces sp. NPDC051218]|uniref:pyridoxal-phosphate dependent enzyme n=1 Tax=Streptomyces sp. NPDC051218 TaxID=3365645 RepID=UPI0037B871F3
MREADIDRSEHGFWRYADVLGLGDGARVRLGETVTPLVSTEVLGRPCSVKLDYLLPTGSYKDRGAAFMLSSMLPLGLTEVVDDSSGNAGAALAGYAAASRIGCTVFAPAGNTPGKLAQMRAYGARVVPVAGPRENAARAARAAAEKTFYASHNYLPVFLRGVATLGLELWEQNHFQLPEHVVVPCGHGSLVLGLHHAFEALAHAQQGGRHPRIHAIQSDRYPAVERAWRSSDADVSAVGGGTTAAEGIACREPLRGAAVLAAIRASGGSVCTVSEDEIVTGLRLLASAGMYSEPTSAAAAAGFRRLVAHGVIRPGESCVVVLTGSGLKTGSAVADLLHPVAR